MKHRGLPSMLAMAFAALGLASAPAMADDLGGIRIAPHADQWEARIGGGVYDIGLFTPHDFNGGTINAEVLAPSPSFLEWLGAPRPYIGADVGLASDPIHFFYTGLNWETQIVKGFYLGFSAGGALATDSEVGPRDLGSNLLFHLQASAGIDITETATLQIYMNHYSNAQLANSNDGIESAGVRLGFRF